MRIAIVCLYYPWPPSVGGVETIVRNVSIELARRGHEVYVITTPFDVTTMKQVSEYGVEEKDGVIIHKLKPGSLRVGYARFLKGLKEAIQEVRPEIVHSHNLHPHLFQLARWKDELNYKLVAELHHPAVELDFLVQKLLMPFAIMGLMYISKAIDAFIAHTTLEKDWLISKGIHNDKVMLVRFPSIPSNLVSYETFSTNLGDIVYLGRIVPRKGLHVLLRALSILKQDFSKIKANIAGPSDPQYLERLKMLARQFGLEDNVSFTGTINEKEKYKFIKSHKVLILPSLKEYTGGVLLEAQTLGVPVVATKVGAVPEMVINGETGLLVEPGDEVGLARAIETLIENEKLRNLFSVRAREWAKNFILEKQVDALENIYHGLLKNG